MLWLQIAVDPVSLLHAPQTRPGSLCASSMFALQFLILSLYYTRLITPEQSLHRSAPFRTCSGRYRQSSRSIQQIPCGTDKVNVFPVTIVVSQLLSRSSTNSWVVTRRSRFLELSSPHRTEVASASILLSVFPVTNNSIIACKPRSSSLSRGPRLQQDWRNAWDSCRLARYRLPPSLLQRCPQKAHTHLLHWEIAANAR